MGCSQIPIPCGFYQFLIASFTFYFRYAIIYYMHRIKKILLAAAVFLLIEKVLSQAIDNVIAAPAENIFADKTSLQNFYKTTNGRVNFFVFTRERTKRFDLLSFYTLLRARVKSFFHHKKLYVINARSSADAAGKVEQILSKKRKLIKNIWFDSHGHYGNRYSSFKIGTDQFSYKNICDSNATKYLQTLAKYCDANTQVGLGSCYAGADFYFPKTDSTPASRMNGDSLMIGMGNIFSHTAIYASESWVMAKPGIFNNRFGFAGYPLQKRFKDSVYAPVWQRIGKWRQYSNGQLQSIPTIALDRGGNIHMRVRDYNSFRKAQRKIAHALKELKPALADFH
jgi:hypothetical protein